MSSQSELGISPVLLQAISQKLSDKPSVQKQQQTVTKSSETSLLQHESISVPVAAEQVTILIPRDNSKLIVLRHLGYYLGN